MATAKFGPDRKQAGEGILCNPGCQLLIPEDAISHIVDHALVLEYELMKGSHFSVPRGTVVQTLHGPSSHRSSDQFLTPEKNVSLA
jgi:hypothetical protein